MILSNPYVQIAVGVLLIIFSYFNLHLTLRRVIDSIGIFFNAFISSPTVSEEKHLKEGGVTMPLGCWTMTAGLGLLFMGIIRLIGSQY